jgi:hypothetical protein
MKSKITALALATGFLTIAAFADTSEFTTAPVPTAVAVTPESTVKQIMQAEYHFRAAYRSSDQFVEILPEPSNSALTPHELVPIAVFSMTSSPVSFNEPDRPTMWFSTVTIRFGSRS